MAYVRTLIVRAPGTNCDAETAFAFQQAGSQAEVVHINRVLARPAMLQSYQVLCLPGGFSYGDDLGAGRIVGGQIRHHLVDHLREFRDAGKLILGICNGFQVLIKSGLLLDESPEETPPATLTWNDSGRFEDRWVHLRAAGGRCVFLQDIATMYLPVAHAEGKFVPRDNATLQLLQAQQQLVLCYSAGAESELGDEQDGPRSQLPFPADPNGSTANVAGVCDTTGRILGLMPHPERFVHRTQHPHWTRRPADAPADGRRIFENAVQYFR